MQKNVKSKYDYFHFIFNFVSVVDNKIKAKIDPNIKVCQFEELKGEFDIKREIARGNNYII